MYKIIKATKDTYITDRVINKQRRHQSNVGLAGSLDLFKLYGMSISGSSPNIELSRLLIKFDLDPVRELLSNNKININHGSFFCKLKLFDVYGGQPTPNNFTVCVNPLSRSFDEGLGRDIVQYSDYDTANFLTGSVSDGVWLLSGANLGGEATTNVDYITTVVINNVSSSLTKTQFFVTGEEDLEVDITNVVSATLIGAIPDQGFRISFSSSLETDMRTYFVKRFASRTAYNEDKHPVLLLGFDDSVQDDTTNLTLESSGTLFLYNYDRGVATNLISGSSQLTGSNSLQLKLSTEVSGGHQTFVFNASQHDVNGLAQVGVYSANVFIPTNSQLESKLQQSGSIRFTPVWGSNDGTKSFLTGSAVYAYPPTRGTVIEPRRYTVSVQGLKAEFSSSETRLVRINIFDATLSLFRKTRVPIETPGLAVRDVFYAIRDVATSVIRVPFDVTKKSTRASSDSNGTFFKLDTSNLVPGRSYVIDVMINDQIYTNASSPFRIT